MPMPPPALSSRPRRRLAFLRWPVSSLRVYLTAVIIVATVPLTGFALFLLHQQAAEARIERQTALYRLVSSLALALEGELASTSDALNLLSHDPALQRGDVAEFERDLARWPLARPSWSSVVLADAQGKPLFSVPPGPQPGSDWQPPAADTPRVGGLRPATAGGPLVTTVELPVQTPEGRFLLVATIGAAQWQKLIDQASVPQDGFVSLVDAGTRVVALSRHPERYVGQVIQIEHLAQVLRSSDPLPMHDSQPLVTLKQVSDTGWWVGAGLTSMRPAWIEVAALWSALAAGLLSLALGLVLALYVGRRVSAPLRQLAHGGAKAVDRHIVVREIGALRDALQAADLERDLAMQALQAKADELQVLLQERLALMQREQDARHAAEDANRGKDEFLAMLGHELRNPLSAISAAVEVINRVDPQHESSKSARRIIARQTQQLVGLMNDLTDMARASTGKVVLGKQLLRLDSLVWRAHAALRVAGRFRHHALTLQLDRVMVEADAMRVEQVVSNLLTNAVKYTPAYGAIAVTLRAADGQAELSVEDTGIGIPPALLPKVFDAFVQGERTAERRQGGLGLGLTLVRRMVELHGGSVQAASAGQGLGSRFAVRLPVADAEPARPPRRPLVLVGAEDEALPVLEALLDAAPRRVCIAPDGPTATERLRQDLLLAGAVVVALPALLEPDLDATLQAWRDAAPGLRLVAVAAAEQQARFLARGFDAAIAPPLSLAELQHQLAADAPVSLAS
jgi:signal transduction histidine kinase